MNNVGLNLIPERDIIQIKKLTSLDSWGLPIEENSNPVTYKCNIKSNEDSTPVTSEGGKQVIPTYSISFNNCPDISVGDFITVDGEDFQVLTKKKVRDLQGEILFTKITA